MIIETIRNWLPIVLLIIGISLVIKLISLIVGLVAFNKKEKE